MINRPKLLMAVFCCITIIFGCKGNHADPPKKKNAGPKLHAKAAPIKKSGSDDAVNTQPPTPINAGLFDRTERPDTRSREVEPTSQLSGANQKIYPPRTYKTAAQPLLPDSISRIQKQAEHYYHSANAEERIRALEEIGKISSDHTVSVGTFVDALNDPDAQVRIEAVNQLSNSDQLEAVNGLLAALDDENPKVVIEALNNLAFLDDPVLIKRISPLLSNPNAQVSSAASKSIEFIKN